MSLDSCRSKVLFLETGIGKVLTVPLMAVAWPCVTHFCLIQLEKWGTNLLNHTIISGFHCSGYEVLADGICFIAVPIRLSPAPSSLPPVDAHLAPDEYAVLF